MNTKESDNMRTMRAGGRSTTTTSSPITSREPQTWVKIYDLPDGHRLFRFVGRAGRFIADDSGATPDTCDDYLRIDRDRPLVAGPGYCQIPVLSVEREDHPQRGDIEYATPTDARTILLLSNIYDWEIQTVGGDITYQATIATSALARRG